MADYDELTRQKLDAVTNYSLFQGNRAWEAVSGGCMPNVYVFADMDRKVTVPGRQDSIPTPLFVMQEESSCWCRLCCNGNQPFVGKMYHAQPVQAGKEACGCYSGHVIAPDKTQPAAMSISRPGCCDKIGGCWVCTACCQNEMFSYIGDTGDQDANALAATGTHTGHSIVPIGGGGCTPTIDMFANAGGQETPFGVLEGPTCFGGCYDLWCTTPFFFSSTKGKEGDLAYLEKQKPDSFFELCCAVCSDADQYKIEMRNAKSTKDKAHILATAVQLDLLFFENDQQFCDVKGTDDGQGVIITITLCMWYCYGCLAPVQCCIVLKGNDGG
jgi:hypothetical protein